MPKSDDIQDSTPLSENAHSDLNSANTSGFMFGLSRQPTQTELVLITKHLAVILFSSALAQWQTLHNLLNPKLSKIIEFIGLGLALLTIFLLVKALEKHGLISFKHHDNHNFDQDECD